MFLPLSVFAALAECTGNPHGAAGVKNKKLFERSELFFV
jgi:hypothetical protein